MAIWAIRTRSRSSAAPDERSDLWRDDGRRQHQHHYEWRNHHQGQLGPERHSRAHRVPTFRRSRGHRPRSGRRSGMVRPRRRHRQGAHPEWSEWPMRPGSAVKPRFPNHEVLGSRCVQMATCPYVAAPGAKPARLAGRGHLLDALGDTLGALHRAEPARIVGWTRSGGRRAHGAAPRSGQACRGPGMGGGRRLDRAGHPHRARAGPRHRGRRAALRTPPPGGTQARRAARGGPSLRRCPRPRPADRSTDARDLLARLPPLGCGGPVRTSRRRTPVDRFGLLPGPRRHRPGTRGRAGRCARRRRHCSPGRGGASSSPRPDCRAPSPPCSPTSASWGRSPRRT